MYGFIINNVQDPRSKDPKYGDAGSFSMFKIPSYFTSLVQAPAPLLLFTGTTSKT